MATLSSRPISYKDVKPLLASNSNHKDSDDHNDEDEYLASNKKPDADRSDSDNEHRALEGTLRQQQIRHAADNQQLRLEYARKVFMFVCVWSSVIMVCMICSSIDGWYFKKFYIESKVLMFLIGSNAVIVGLFTIVLRYLFSNDSPILHQLVKALKK